ncbi:cysteine ABC transporter permease/ATP-binding protein CydC [Bacillus freudenreichii]|nr:cysteine ABC transporter permease/ATP-binding protein CydC [Bacillus freudenreichii]
MRRNEWIRSYLKENRALMLLTIVLGALGICSGAALLFISGYLISTSSLQPESIMIVYVPIVAVRAFSICRPSFHYVERLVGHDVVLRIVEKMRMNLYRLLEPQALLLRSRYRTGDLLAVLSDDIDHLQNLYLRTIFPSIVALVIYGGLIFALGLVDWTFAMLMALMVAVIVFLIPCVSFVMSRREHLFLKEERNQLYQQLTDAVLGLADWKASGRTDEFLRSYTKQEERLVQTERTMKRKSHIRDFILQFIFGMVVMAMIIWSGIQAESGTMTPTFIAAFVLMTVSLADALLPVSAAVEQIPAYDDSVKRISSIKDLQVVEDEDEKSISFVKNEPVHIEIDSLSYRYSNQSDWMFRNFSLTIPAGRKIAILGRSGTGKSTLIKLLSGALQPTEGTIRMNNSDCVPETISVLNQQPHLFDTTVGNNIRIGRPDASDEEIWQVAEQAQLTPLLASLPLGLQTPMHEMGKRFSGGERQRIAFARVLLQQRPVVLLDEPANGLDPETESALIHTILSAADNKTILFVTHHLIGMEQMDELIFLEEGKISMQGSHKQLMDTSEKYRLLYKMDRGYV